MDRFGLLCPLVTLLNPYGIKAILATFTVAYGNEAVPFITEWQPFDASQDTFQEAILLLSIFGLLVRGCASVGRRRCSSCSPCTST